MPLRLIGYAAAALWGVATELPRQREIAKRQAIVSIKSPGHEFSRLLRNLKKRPKEMAFAMGVTTSTVFRLLRDEQPITRDIAEKIVYAAGCGTVSDWIEIQRRWDTRHTLPR